MTMPIFYWNSVVSGHNKTSKYRCLIFHLEGFGIGLS